MVYFHLIHRLYLSNCLHHLDGKEWNAATRNFCISYILQTRTNLENRVLFWWCVMVCKIFFCPEFLDITQKTWRSKKRWRKPANKPKIILLRASILVAYYIKLFHRSRQRQRYFNVSSPSSRRYDKNGYLFIGGPVISHKRS